MATDLKPELLSDLTCHVEKLDVTNREAIFDLIGTLKRRAVDFS